MEIDIEDGLIAIDKIIDHLENYPTAFQNSLVKSANAYVRGEIEKSLSAVGYDTGKPFVKAVIGSYYVECNESDFSFQIKTNFKSVEIITEWVNANGNCGESKIDSLDILEIMDKGRGAYTIEAKQSTNGVLAIPPAGQRYDPANKANTIVKSGVTNVRAKRGANITEIADDALAVWLENENVRIMEWVNRTMMVELEKFL